MTKLTIQGMRDPRPEPVELGRGLPAGQIVLKDAVLVQAARDASQQVIEGLQPDDVVEIELQDGLRIWSRLEDVPRDLVRRKARGQEPGDAIALPPVLAIGPSSRALGGLAIKALKVLGIDIAGTITDFVGAHVEGQLQPGPGLYRAVEDDAAALRPAAVEGDGPALLFLHGTASSTAGSFGQLWNAEVGAPIRTLFKHYGGRVLAFQHRSLTESPIANALALVEALEALLGRDAEVHIVSHSRGGLVGELLALGMRVGAAPVTPDDLALFGKGREVDREQLADLSARLEAARLRVTRFVRVACPARGTTLADGRLDRYVSMLVNLAAFVPGLAANPVYDGLTSLLAGVLKKRTDPRELPGIEAMMPTSPLVRMLNQPDLRTAAGLHVIGGDLAGTGVFGRLKTLATDLYYRDDHDLVVNTPAMLGGAERVDPVRYWIDTGDRVTHFNYFLRSDTSRRMVAALTGASADFRTLEARPSGVTAADYQKRAALPRPIVIVLPGIMGSELAVGKERVWVSLRALARGGMTSLAAAASGVEPTGLVADGYAALCAHLDHTHRVVPFAYDWRQSVTEAALRLRQRLEEELPHAESMNQPIRLLAHSMGGLVVRAMLATDEGRALWERACRHPGARFVMLGTPNGGSHAIAAMLMGRDALVKKLALVDLQSSHAQLLETIAGFEGALNLLPVPAGAGLDLFDRAVWDRLLDLDAPEGRGLFGSGVATDKSAGFTWTRPASALLARARAAADRIGRSPLDPGRTVYVAGVAEETACDITLHPDVREGRRVKVLASSRGDGRVLWDTGIPPGIPAFYMDTPHGDLANDRRHFAALADLLEHGTTTRLPAQAPVSRAADEPVEWREPVAAMVPDEQELTAAALGGRHARFVEGQVETKIHVAVRHDNLSNARSPVLVSHYQHDVIVAAEAYLDWCLKGRLSELLRMELYPGPIDTGVVVLNDVQGADLTIHPGAIVAGLGVIGQLTPGALTSTLAHALTLYGADRVGRERRQQQRIYGDAPAIGTVSAAVTAVLIGSGDGGLSLTDSVRAVLRAVLQANQRLRSARPAAASDTLIAQIDRLEIIELYEDRAIEALHQLQSLAQAPEFDQCVVQPLIDQGDDGQRRVRFEQAPGWWQRLRIHGKDESTLEFEAVTQLARAPAREIRVERGKVEGFIADAIQTTTHDPRLGRTLFELIVPNDFKPYAPERVKVALMLDPQTADYPWELLQDGFDRAAEPISVAGGMVRQLSVVNERGQVLRAPKATALVIGDPIVSDGRFAPLSGAAAEAAHVATLLGEGQRYDVTLLLQEAATPRAFLTAIHEQPWRILHLAAHGVFEFAHGDGRIVTGLVLDNGLYFSPEDADQMRHVPELVFINCCHLGQTRGEVKTAFHRLAANIGTQFIRMGARAVVAAGWAVDDRAAKTFASTFYRCMLDGWLYGDAVLQARRDTYSQHGQTNSWGAYQCYGDVSFSLAAGTPSRREETFVSGAELRLWLEGMVRRARGRDPKQTDALVAELRRRQETTPEAWWTQADLNAAAGEAFAELGAFESAVTCYQAVLRAERAVAPIRALEQLANCRVRWADALLRAEPRDVPRIAALLDEAEGLLRRLIDIGSTVERQSLLGGTLKRKARLATTRKDARDAVQAMRDAYDAAYKVSLDAGAGDAYPLANLIAAEIVLSWTDTAAKLAGRTATVAELMAALDRTAQALAATRTDAFNLSAAADRLFLQALLDRAFDARTVEQIELKFKAALSRGSSARQRQSMKQQLEFFVEMLKTQYPAQGRDETRAQLEQLQSIL